jgi:hypothetical protein
LKRFQNETHKRKRQLTSALHSILLNDKPPLPKTPTFGADAVAEAEQAAQARRVVVSPLAEPAAISEPKGRV